MSPSVNNVDMEKMSYADISSFRETLVHLVIRAITDAINRVKISIILPQLLENRRILVETLQNTKYERAIFLVNDFYRRRDIILREQRSPLMDLGMIRIIDYFQVNNDMFEKFAHFENKMSKKEKELLSAFKMVKELANRRCQINAYDHIKEERRLQILYRKNKSFQEKFRALQQHNNKLHRRLTLVEGSKNELTKQLEFQIKNTQEFFEQLFLQEQ